MSETSSMILVGIGGGGAAVAHGVSRAFGGAMRLVTIDTDASTVSIPLRRLSQPQGTRLVMGEVAKADGELPALYEGFSVEVDGELHPYLQYFDSSLYIDISGNAGRLPGFGDVHRIRVWLPAMEGVELSEVCCDGSFISPVPARRTVLALGDSIVQGYAATAPARTWAARLAKLLDADVVNQGIGAHVFQPGTVPRLDVPPCAVIVAYGENYRYEALPLPRIDADIRAYLREVASVFEGVP
ncbi:MAG: SGNH/GDSL hydrolase family protein, partial [Kiritimatiellae bacterium]|nr:SGNH/GDSL hydrolase family protein [Kiritimatiellia bacterium]